MQPKDMLDADLIISGKEFREIDRLRDALALSYGDIEVEISDIGLMRAISAVLLAGLAVVEVRD